MRFRSALLLAAVPFLLAAVPFLVASCGGSSDPSAADGDRADAQGDAAPDASKDAASQPEGGADADASSVADAGSDADAHADANDADGGACAPQVSVAQPAPVDLIVLLDQTASMGGAIAGNTTKWSAATAALQAFVAQPASTASVGLQYFPLEGSACTRFCLSGDDCQGFGPCESGVAICATCVGLYDSCHPPDYASLAVAVDALPANATAIEASLAAHGPRANSGTPTVGALHGVLDEATAWAGAHRDHRVAVVFATTAMPNECQEQDTPSIAAFAAAAFAATPPVETYGVGFFDGPGAVAIGATLLDPIAAAGGTGQSVEVDTSVADLQAAFLDALNAARGGGCVYATPVVDGGVASPGSFAMQWVPGGATVPTSIPGVAGPADCATGDGWFFDDPTTPSQIRLCPATCAAVRADAQAEVDVVLACDADATP